MMEQNNEKKLYEESMEETSAKPLSKVQQMEKAIEEMNTRNGWKSIKGKPRRCTIIFKNK